MIVMMVNMAVIVTLMVSYPYPGGEDNKDPVEDDQGCQEAQQDEPEPQEDVDLLIH